MIATYFSLIHRRSATEYEATFPDFPECRVGASSFDEARSLAEQEIASHLERIGNTRGARPPDPRSRDEIQSDPGNTRAMLHRIEVAAKR